MSCEAGEVNGRSASLHMVSDSAAAYGQVRYAAASDPLAESQSRTEISTLGPYTDGRHPAPTVGGHIGCGAPCSCWERLSVGEEILA